MPSNITLALGTALAGIALCCFVESSFAQDALVASLEATETTTAMLRTRTIKTKNPAGVKHVQQAVSSSRFLTRSSDNMSLGLTSVGEAAEAEGRRYRNMVRHLSGAVSRVTAGGGDANQCRQENLVRKTSRVPRLRR